jgi:hypothetical protein
MILGHFIQPTTVCDKLIWSFVLLVLAGLYRSRLNGPNVPKGPHAMEKKTIALVSYFLIPQASSLTPLETVNVNRSLFGQVSIIRVGQDQA